MTPENFVRLTSPLWKWILDNGEHWTAKETAEVVQTLRLVFIACGGQPGKLA